MDLYKEYTVTKNNILAKCRWSPFGKYIFQYSIHCTFVNGREVYKNGRVMETRIGERMLFKNNGI
jgi:dihydroorotase